MIVLYGIIDVLTKVITIFQIYGKACKSLKPR